MCRLQLQHRYDSGHIARLRATLLNEDTSLIYVNSIASARMIDLFSSVDCPVICHIHELEWAIRALGVENLARLEERRPLYIAVSLAVRNNLVENHGIPANRVVVIHGFVPSPQTRERDPEKTGETISRKLGIAEGAELVCACGSIETRKGTDLFLQVASKVVQEYRATPVHFVWVGGTPDKVAAMRGRVANSTLKGVVHFVGHTPNTGAYFRASKVFLLTSREDPFPLVVMEAAQAGNPIVCFEDSGGAPEFVEHDAGFVIPDFNVARMGDKIIELLSSPVICDRMGQAAKQKVMSRYGIELGAAKIAATIENTIRVCGD
jgi:glycosyltransferase involved in cell wall biosynthesis